VRLHRLAITGFGPFAGSEEVDLDALSSSGLFLIHGPTGAGKSSILDAICFALYAAVPGARAGARASLRSDHAADGVIPQVTLELTAAGRRLRVRRSPEFSRPKKRGTGATTVPPKVVLEELVGSVWEVRGTRLDEVALVLDDVLGMGMEQFTKLVLLPQGDFATFLRASPEGRRCLLEKLFDTRRFTDVETWLLDRRRRTSDVLGIARGELSTGLLRVDDVLTRLDPDEDLVRPPWSDVPHHHVGTLLVQLVSAVDLRAGAALAEVDVATATVVQTESAVHCGIAVSRQQRTAADARDQLRGLDDERKAYREAQRSLAVAQQANAVSGFVAALASATGVHEVARAEVVVLREPFAHLLDPGDKVDRQDVSGPHNGADADALATEALIDQVAGHSGALQQAQAQATRASALAHDSAEHRLAALRDEALVSELTRERADADADRAAAEASRDRGQAAAARLPGLAARHKSLSRVQSLLADQERSAGDLAALQREVDSAERLLLGARGHLLDLRERRLVGMAAELANGISSGGPCPVCGSCAHPNPAMTTDLVSPSDLRSAEADQTRASEALTQARSTAAAELAGQQARAAEITAGRLSTDAFEVRDLLVASAAAIAQAGPAAASLPQAQVQLATSSKEVERLRGLLEQTLAAKASSSALAASASAQSRTAQTEAAELLASHGNSCPCAAGENDHARDVSEVISRHRQTMAQLRSLARGLQELVTHAGSVHEAGLTLGRALKVNGFTSLEQALDGVRSAADVQELTAFLRVHEEQRAQANALLAQPEVIDAVQRPTPDLAALAEAHVQAAAWLTRAGRRHTLLEQAQRDLRGLSRIVRQALIDLDPAEKEAQIVQELADCVSGNSVDNALRMRLSSYVLAARLAEIATLANERLGTMSDGRYTLEYTDARAARGARSGLGLLVRDAWTGQSRETSSLSGGEAFMASLALALGLGDAVRAESGGFDLQTLFVDEGFGSLDEESLEQVMAVLDTLREGGRAVGIVSHVSELKTRIPHQLCVLKQHAGSRISTGQPDRPAA